MTDTALRDTFERATWSAGNNPPRHTDDQEVDRIHAINGRLWVDTRCQGEWGSRPIEEVIDDGERQRDAARARLAEADRRREARLLPLRVARMVGDWNQAAALQRDVDRAEHAAHEARDAIDWQHQRLARFEQARHDHLRCQRARPRPRQKENSRQMDMLDALDALDALDTWDALDASPDPNATQQD